ncbi:hypothetical protein WJX77_012481 [Trebouxia sp. C0004]
MMGQSFLVSRRHKLGQNKARQSYAASTLSDEEYAALLDQQCAFLTSRWAFVWLPWLAVARWQVTAQMICKTQDTSWSWFAAFVQNPCQCKSWHWPTTLAKQIRMLK